MNKSKPERTCIVCRTKGDKSKFLKIVLNKNGEIAIEKNKRLDGRGAYICKNEECLKKCIKAKALNRAFKTNVSGELYRELESGFKED